MKWAGTGYEIVLEKLEMLESWKSTGDIEIKEGILDWMIENEESTLMEEGEEYDAFISYRGGSGN